MASDPAVSWALPFLSLFSLATSMMSQPAGRLMGAPFACSTFLRASPILCAFDTLVLVIRCVAYSSAFRITPRQALVLAGKDRFDELGEGTGETQKPRTYEGMPSRTTRIFMKTFSSSSRLVRFAITTIPLLKIAQNPSVRWTQAWGWMYVGAYLTVEAAIQAYRWSLHQDQADGQNSQDDGDDVNHSEVDESVRLFQQPTSNKEGDEAPLGDALGTARYGQTRKEKVDADDNHDGFTLAAIRPTRAKPPSKHSRFSINEDVETARRLITGDATGGHNTLPRYETVGLQLVLASDSIRLAKINQSLSRLSRVCYFLGVALHVLFIYWLFLDLVQPPINKHILAVDPKLGDGWQINTSWNTTLVYLSLPFIAVIAVLALILSFVSGGLLFMSIYGAGALTVNHLPQPVKEFAGGIVVAVLSLGTIILGIVCLLAAYALISPIVAVALLTGRMQWIYKMLPVEMAVLALFFLGCSALYLFLRSVGAGVRYRSDEAGYPFLWSPMIALLTGLVITFLLTMQWYRLRFAGSAHWAQNWRDALVSHGDIYTVTVTFDGTTT